MIFQKIGCQYEKTDDTVQTETYTDSIIHFFSWQGKHYFAVFDRIYQKLQMYQF